MPDTERANVINEEGSKLAQRGLLWFAKRKFEKAIKLDPQCHGAYTNLGTYHRSKGNSGLAHQLYSRALELAPDDWAPHMNLLEMYRAESRFSEMAPHFSGVLRSELANDPEVARIMRAKMLQTRGMCLGFGDPSLPTQCLETTVSTTLVGPTISGFDQMSASQRSNAIIAKIQHSFYLAAFIDTVERADCRYSNIVGRRGQPWQESIDLQSLKSAALDARSTLNRGDPSLSFEIQVDPQCLERLELLAVSHGAENTDETLAIVVSFVDKVQVHEGRARDTTPIIRGLEPHLDALQQQLVLAPNTALVVDQPETVNMTDIYAHNVTDHASVPLFVKAG